MIDRNLCVQSNHYDWLKKILSFYNHLIVIDKLSMNKSPIDHEILNSVKPLRLVEGHPKLYNHLVAINQLNKLTIDHTL